MGGEATLASTRFVSPRPRKCGTPGPLSSHLYLCFLSRTCPLLCVCTLSSVILCSHLCPTPLPVLQSVWLFGSFTKSKAFGVQFTSSQFMLVSLPPQLEWMQALWEGKELTYKKKKKTTELLTPGRHMSSQSNPHKNFTSRYFYLHFTEH